MSTARGSPCIREPGDLVIGSAAAPFDEQPASMRDPDH